MSLLALRAVGRRFDAVDGLAGPEVLRGVDLVVEPGDALAIVGPSGSGKSTLLNLIGALDRPTSGTVLFEGRDLAALDERALAELRARRIGFVFQTHHLLPQCTALENALVPTLLLPSSERPAAAARVRALLARVGLEARARHRPRELSGGERARVALVRALANAPALVLADEPTGALDARHADELADLLLELRSQQRVALVVVTHSERLARRLDRVLRLVEGRLEPAEVAR